MLSSRCSPVHHQLAALAYGCSPHRSSKPPAPSPPDKPSHPSPHVVAPTRLTVEDGVLVHPTHTPPRRLWQPCASLGHEIKRKIENKKSVLVQFLEFRALPPLSATQSRVATSARRGAGAAGAHPRGKCAPRWEIVSACMSAAAYAPGQGRIVLRHHPHLASCAVRCLRF